MKPLDVLIAGREVIADPRNWTQGTFARNKAGDPLPHPWDKDATCFCSMGAIHKVVGMGAQFLELKRKTKDFLFEAAGRVGPMWFNDHRTHSEVIAVWDKAIALADHE